MRMETLLVAPMLVKDISIKTLVTDDKSARIVLETIEPETIEQLAKLVDKKVVYVVITETNDEGYR